MHGNHPLNRARFDNDQAFELAVDHVASKLNTEQKRELMFSLMRQCRGCGADATFEGTELARRESGRVMACKSCAHDVPLTSPANSIGQMITLWNTTPLTIEAAHV